LQAFACAESDGSGRADSNSCVSDQHDVHIGSDSWLCDANLRLFWFLSFGTNGEGFRLWSGSAGVRQSHLNGHGRTG